MDESTLILGGAVGVSLGQPGKFRVRSFKLAVPGLPPRLSGMTIAHLSDFHVGRFMTPGMMRPVIDAVNDMKPDMVLITGDLIDYALIDLPPAIDELRRLRRRLQHLLRAPDPHRQGVVPEHGSGTVPLHRVPDGPDPVPAHLHRDDLQDRHPQVWRVVL